jgi:hypothetical protein
MRVKSMNRQMLFSFTSILLIAGSLLQGGAGNCNAALSHPDDPDGGKKMVREQSGQILEQHPPRGYVRDQEMIVSDPHRQYVVSLQDLAAGQLLSAATFSSWHYTLTQGTNLVGMAALRHDEKTGELKLAGMYDPGPPLDAEREALRRAEKLSQVQKQDYEFRLLDIEPFYFHAVWLHGKSDDIILPLPETFGKMKAYEPYSESQTVKLLRPGARKALKTPGQLR